MSYRKEVIKGAFWIAIAKYSGIVIQILITAILARLISPTAFGTIAVAMVILSFLNILADIGIGVAVIQFKSLTQLHLNSLFTLNIYIGIVLSIIFYASSEYIATYYNDEVLIRVCQTMAVVVFFNSLNVVPNALMRKDKRFRTIAIRTLFFQILSGILAVWGAYHGWGIYALLVSPVLTSIGVFCVNYYNYPMKYVVSMSKEAVYAVSSYSIFQFAFSFCNYFSRNLDKLIIGKFFSMTQLGYYDKSYHLMLMPLQNITFVVEPVLHPILSSLQEKKQELGEKNIKLSSIISQISFPIGLICYFCAGEIIRIVYGNQWDAAVPVFRILALSLPLQMIQSTSGAIYQAAGKTNHMFYNGVLNTCITITGFVFSALFFGTIESMAWAFVLTLLINFIDSYLILYYKTIKSSVWPFFKTLLPQILNSTLVFVICMYLFKDNCEKVFLSIIEKGIVIFTSTIILSLLMRQYKIKELFYVFRK